MTVAVGFFDGVHLGHREILRGADRALTFKTHPLALLRPERAPRLIMPLEARLAAIRACGVREVVALDFTPELSSLSPAEFAARFLGDPSTVVACGDNWRFGRGGAGDAAFLRSLGYPVRVAPYAVDAGEPISSTRIRRALEAGAIAEANAMLGRPHAVFGETFAGKGEGRHLGYPTINVKPFDGVVRLPPGVYVADVDGRRAVANYGYAPTFGARAWAEPVWEFHLLAAPEPDFSPQTCSFGLLSYLRPERTFVSVAELQAQIARDCAAALACG